MAPINSYAKSKFQPL